MRIAIATVVVVGLYLGVLAHQFQLHAAPPKATGELPPLVYPGKDWQSLAPAELGLDAAKLDALAQYVGGMGCVVRNGYLAYAWGDVTQRVDIASACKPWYSHLLFTAIEEGKLKSIDEPLIAVEPRLAELNASLGHKDREILWRHLISQTSCYGVTERPGTAFDYSDYNMALLFDNLFLKLYSATMETATAEVLNRRLTDWIGCQDAPRFNGKGRLAASPRDCARFGLLYLRDGNWNGKQLLSREHVRTILNSPLSNSIPRTEGKPAEMIAGQRSIGGGSNQTDHHGSYSFTWWTNGINRQGQRHWPDVPINAFGAFGHKGKRAIVVLPDDELVIVWNEANIVSAEMENRALQLLLAARQAIAKPTPAKTNPAHTMPTQR